MAESGLDGFYHFGPRLRSISYQVVASCAILVSAKRELIMVFRPVIANPKTHPSSIDTTLGTQRTVLMWDCCPHSALSQSGNADVTYDDFFRIAKIASSLSQNLTT